jgi:thiamine pyrophosphate-dependent acetolactate synthase large subunit-like protein
MSDPRTAENIADMPRVPLVAALEVLADLRGARDIVVTTMGTAREWPQLSRHPLDFHYIPSTMGGGIPLGLGLALAKPNHHVLVFSGDGSLLMSLGTLITVVDSGAGNLTVVLFDNGVYEVTGGQKTAAAGRGTDFAGLARACGFRNVAAFSNLDGFRRRVRGVLQRPGPRLVWIMVEPVLENYALILPGSMHDRLPRFRQALQDG